MIVCAWDGATYILDQSRNVVRYKFEENVCAFCAGILLPSLMWAEGIVVSLCVSVCYHKNAFNFIISKSKQATALKLGSLRQKMVLAS